MFKGGCKVETNINMNIQNDIRLIPEENRELNPGINLMAYYVHLSLTLKDEPR